MSLANSLDVIKNLVIDGMTGFTEDNCRVSDESGLYIWMNTESTDTMPIGCLIESDAFANSNASEFKSITIRWRINVLFTVGIHEDEIQESVFRSHQLTDEFLSLIVVDPTVGKQVTRVKPIGGLGPKYPYKRANHDFVVMLLTIEVMENIS